MSSVTIPPPLELTRSAVAPSAVTSPAHARGASILIASLNRPRGITGVHTHTSALCDGLQQFGYSAQHVNPFSGSQAWLAFFAARPLLDRINKTAATLWYRHWHAAALRTNLSKACAASPDVILAQCPVSACVALDVRAKRNLRTVVALVAHFNHSEAEEYRQLGSLSDSAYQRMLEFENRVLREVDQVIYVSDFARQVVESERKVQIRRSTVIHNGIPDVSKTANITRADLGLSPDDLVLINVGTLEPRKNQLNLLNLFDEIRKHHANAKLLLVGDGSHRAQLESSIRTRDLTDSVKLLGSRSDVHDLLSLADLYIHYAKLENCPVVLLEAARAGVPFAAIPSGGIPELQSSLNVNIALDPANIHNSFTTLHPLLGNPQLRGELGSRARAAFESHFTTAAMTRAYLEAMGLMRGSAT
jgi:glycosyltransferase involved in cell wall biosynthesis